MNSLVRNQPVQRKKFSVAIQEEGYKNLINNTLQDPKRAMNFVANISTVVAINPALQECNPATILSGGLMAETLGLSLNPQLRQAHLVPFKKKDKGGNVVDVLATFMVGWVGYYQLAMRTGAYKFINAVELKKGELISWNKLTEQYKIEFIEDDEIREKTETEGYIFTFQLTNGFTKTLYWTKKKMMIHAKTYSQAYRSDLQYNSKNSYWTTSFDDMAIKTLYRQGLSKYGILSIELEKAMMADMAVISENENGNKYNYVDNEKDVSDLSEENTISNNADPVVEEIKVEEPKPIKKASPAIEEVKKALRKTTPEEVEDPFQKMARENNLFEGDF